MREQQDAHTGQVLLTGVSRRGYTDGEPEEFGWFAVTGRAAADASEVSLTSAADAATEPVCEIGLVFTLVRTRTGENPEIRVHTQDGRSVPIRP
jgi:hypothetical protein